MFSILYIWFMFAQLCCPNSSSFFCVCRIKEWVDNMQNDLITLTDTASGLESLIEVRDFCGFLPSKLGNEFKRMGLHCSIHGGTCAPWKKWPELCSSIPYLTLLNFILLYFTLISSICVVFFLSFSYLVLTHEKKKNNVFIFRQLNFKRL